jgi:outer membrane protein TolC
MTSRRGAFKAALTMALMVVASLSLGAQQGGEVLTLDRAVAEALAQGDQQKILEGNLAVARAQNALTVARNSLTLAGSLGYGASTDLGNTTVSTGAESGVLSGVPQSAQLGLSLVGPLTVAQLSGSPYTPATGTTGSSSTIGLSLTQTLWNGYPGGTGRATVQKSNLSLQGSELATQAGRSAFVYQVQQAYYTLLAAQQNLALLKDILDQQKALLNQIQAVYDLKQASLVDLQAAQINVQSAQVNLRRGEQSRRFSRITLANLIGRAADVDYTVAEPPAPEVPAKTAVEAVAEGLKRRPELRQFNLDRRSLAIDLALIRGQATPSVSLVGGLAWAFDYGSGDNGGLLTGGVKVGMPLLDSGAVHDQKEANRHQAEVYAAQESQLRANIAASIENAFESVEVSRQQQEVAGLRAQNLKAQLQVVDTEYRYGTATTQDLLTASVNAANAQTALLQARSDLQLAILQLRNAMGY